MLTQRWIKVTVRLIMDAGSSFVKVKSLDKLLMFWTSAFQLVKWRIIILLHRDGVRIKLISIKHRITPQTELHALYTFIETITLTILGCQYDTNFTHSE